MRVATMVGGDTTNPLSLGRLGIILLVAYTIQTEEQPRSSGLQLLAFAAASRRHAHHEDSKAAVFQV